MSFFFLSVPMLSSALSNGSYSILLWYNDDDARFTLFANLILYLAKKRLTTRVVLAVLPHHHLRVSHSQSELRFQSSW